MKLISHRGLWRHPTEKNTLAAIEQTLAAAFGTETDVRDHDGQLVISHDPPRSGALECRRVVDLFRGSGLTLAVNIKADGLAPQLEKIFRGADLDWFAFDMSAPEMLRFCRLRLPFFTRHSDIEPDPILYQEAAGVWLDAFSSDWFDAAVIERHAQAGKRVCVVSSELHGRDPEALWRGLRRFASSSDIVLCTDRPEAAKKALTL